MKFRATFEAPDEIFKYVLKQAGTKYAAQITPFEITPEIMNHVINDVTNDMTKFASEFVKDNKTITIEFDFQEGTATVVPIT